MLFKGRCHAFGVWSTSCRQPGLRLNSQNVPIPTGRDFGRAIGVWIGARDRRDDAIDEDGCDVPFVENILA